MQMFFQHANDDDVPRLDMPNYPRSEKAGMQLQGQGPVARGVEGGACRREGRRCPSKVKTDEQAAQYCRNVCHRWQVKHWFAAQGLSISDPDLLWDILAPGQKHKPDSGRSRGGGLCQTRLWSRAFYPSFEDTSGDRELDLEELIQGPGKERVIVN